MLATRFLFATLLTLSGVFLLPSSASASSFNWVSGSPGQTSLGSTGWAQYIEATTTTYVNDMTLYFTGATNTISVTVVDCTAADYPLTNYLSNCSFVDTYAKNDPANGEVSFDTDFVMYIDRTYVLLIQLSNTSGDSPTTPSTSLGIVPGEAPYYSSRFYVDETVQDDYDYKAPTGSATSSRTYLIINDTGLNADGFKIDIDDIAFLDLQNDIAYDTTCSTDSNQTAVASCWHATSTEGIAVDWTFTTLNAGSHTIHSQLLMYDDGSIPYGHNPDLYNFYYDSQELVFSQSQTFVTSRITYSGYATTADKFILRVCAEPNDFMYGAYDCAEMVICNGTVTDADCQESASVVAYGAPIIPTTTRPESCTFGDILCYLQIAFIPSSTTMRQIAGEATSTIANAWPLGYFYREWASFINATPTDFEISLDMSAFQSDSGPGITNLTASGTPVGTINISEASRQAHLLIDPTSTNNNDFIDIVENFIFAFWWLFFAWRIAFGLYPALTDSYGTGERQRRLQYNHDRAYVDRQALLNRRRT